MIKNSAVALLLEDEPLISMDLELTLGDAGFAVTTVMSCEEANAWLENDRPDIVIVDVMLRDGPSEEIAERLVKSKIPFIVHSGGHPSQHVGTPFEQGTWVSKPAAPGKLVEAAWALLSN